MWITISRPSVGHYYDDHHIYIYIYNTIQHTYLVRYLVLSTIPLCSGEITSITHKKMQYKATNNENNQEIEVSIADAY